MKKLLILLALFTLSCKAQNPIFPISYSALDVPVNSYIKDIDNDLNKYTGEWKFENATQVFTLKIGKKIMYFDTDYNIYEDLLFGEYEFKENNISLINTLPNYTLTDDPYEHAIEGNLITSAKNFPICHNCLPNELRVKLSISDPERPWVNAYIVLQHINEFEGEESLIATIFYTSTLIPYGSSTPSTLRIPAGEYVLIKQ